MTAEKAPLSPPRRHLSDEKNKLADSVTTAEDGLAQAKRALAEKLIANPAADVTAEKTAVTTAETKLNDEKKKLADAVSDGLHLTPPISSLRTGRQRRRACYALEKADLFNLLCLPRTGRDGIKSTSTQPGLPAAAAYCEKRRAMLLVDPPERLGQQGKGASTRHGLRDTYLGIPSKNAALFFPRLTQPNPLARQPDREFVPCGAVAGIFARTDTQRGVWKAPAGLEATLVGVPAARGAPDRPRERRAESARHQLPARLPA